jgi:hypothetical protein
VQTPQRSEPNDETGSESQADLCGTAFSIKRFEQFSQNIEHSGFPSFFVLEMSLILAHEAFNFSARLMLGLT